MQYDPIKKTLDRFFSGSLFRKKLFFLLLDLLLLRTWHVKRALRKLGHSLPENAKILDAGAGFGQYSWHMSRINSNWKIKAVDIDKEHIKSCSRFFEEAGLTERITCEQCDLTRMRESDEYDLILSVDVMEHIEEDELVFRNFCRALKNNGIVLISTPSDRGGSDVHSDHGQSFIDEHVRDGYGTDEISIKLQNAGFRNVQTAYTYGKPGQISWMLSMKIPVILLGISKLLFILLPLYYLIIFPVSLILNTFDVNMTHNSGTGLLVTAKR
jgi:SAM-dependent methyltransferase